MLTRSPAFPSLPHSLLAAFAAKFEGDPPTPEDRQRLVRLADLARENEAAARSFAEHWSAVDPVGFFRAAVDALREPREEVEIELLRKLLHADLLAAALLEPGAYSEKEAAELAQELKSWVPDLDLCLARRALGDETEGQKRSAPPVVQRALVLLAAVSPGERIVPFLLRACRISDQRISSQVARLAGRYRARGLLVRLLEDANPRVRANAVESLADARYLSDRRELLWRAAADEHHRVAVNALVALARLGEREALERLEEFARHPAPEFRAAAAWGMGELGEPGFQPVLGRLYQDASGIVRRNALRALVRLRKVQAAGLAHESASGPGELAS